MGRVSHLESAIDGTVLPARTLQSVHAGRPLWVRYDLPALAAQWHAGRWRCSLATRESSLWRYRELLPVEDEADIVSLGETMTPLIDCPRLARHCHVARLLVKDESRLPTGSFKARGMALAVSMAKALGVTRVALPTAGNAGGALAAYAARAGMEAWVFMPEDTPAVNRCEAALFGAHAFTVDGLITDCGAIVREGAERGLWFDMSTLKEPYRIEGKKTMGLELAEQLDWKLPDVILYPTGGGTGLIGMWKAFGELAALRFLADPRMPRLYACQSDGCAPIVAAFDKGERFGIEPAAPATIASGLRVPKALGDFMILDAVRASGGCALVGFESEIAEFMATAMELEGISLCPESAVCLSALRRGKAGFHINKEETVVLFNTGAAQKYVEVMEAKTGALPRLDKRAVDWSAIETAGRTSGGAQRRGATPGGRTFALTAFEKAGLDMLLAGEGPALEILRRQAAACSVTERSFTGCGFFTELSVPADCELIPSRSRLVFSEVVGTIDGFEPQIGFLLFGGDGKLQTLECYVFGDGWPERVESWKLRYFTDDEPRRRGL